MGISKSALLAVLFLGISLIELVIIVVLVGNISQKCTAPSRPVPPPAPPGSGESEDQLKISSFNIQIFGVTKFGKEEVVANLIRIIKRYDLVLVQEIRDSSETVILELVDLLNSDLSPAEKYEVLVSDRLGRSSSKEQYAYIYKPSKLAVKDSYVYDDELAGDLFEREPYVVWFQPTVTSIADFAVIGCHVKPDDAVKEINYFAQVYDDLLDRHNNNVKDVLFMGDWNADCSYVGTTEWDQVTFRHDERFTWLLDDDIDSTVAKSSCAYDRFAIAGEDMHRAYVADSAGVFYFDEAYGLDEELTKDISDHYPIELLLKPNTQTRQEL